MSEKKCETCKEIKIDTMGCPAHGVFCGACGSVDINGSTNFPFVICPKCDITIAEIYKKNKPTGPNGTFKNLVLPESYVLLRDDSTGYWIGKTKMDP